MWGDALLISGLAAFVVGRYSPVWRRSRSLLLSLVLGFASATLLSWFYTLSEMPEAHVQNHHLTSVGLVHLIYMGVALSIFTQFFFLTDNVGTGMLGVVGALVLVHVFFGTHMALGLLTAVHPQHWYPAQPLRSIAGWTTIALVALGLVARIFSIAAIFRVIARAITKATTACFAVVMYLINQNIRSAEGYLRFLDYICGFVTFAFFFKLFASRWQQGRHSLALILLLVVGIVYYLSRLSVKQELAIGKSLFLSDRIPTELQLNDRLKITFQVISFLALYLILGFIVDYIVLASACMFIIACIDFNTRKQIAEKARQYFADADYAPSPDERGYAVINERRAVFTSFLFNLPHLRKEGWRAAGCAVALSVAVYAYLRELERISSLAYIVLIGTLVLNEVITWWWRIDRDRRLKLI